MKKVAIVINMPATYRTPLFQELNNSKDYEFCVLYSTDKEKNRDWKVDYGSGYAYKKLRSITFGLMGHLSWEVVREIKKGQYDVVVTSGINYPNVYLALFTAKKLGKKTILWFDGEFKKNEDRFRYNIRKHTYQAFDAMLLSGKNAGNFMRFYDIPEERMFFSPLVCENEKFHQAAEWKNGERDEFRKQYYHAAPNDIVFLYVGRLVARKGIDLLLKTFLELAPLYSNIRLAIIGEGPLQLSLREEAEPYAERIHFLGYRDNELLPHFYSASEVAVLPSMHRDSWGLVINEALACDTPVISSDLMGASYDLIENNVNGYCFKTTEPDELRRIMKSLIENPTQIETWRKMTYPMIAPHNFTQYAEDFHKVLDYVCGK